MTSLDIICSICLSNLGKLDSLSSTKCGHVFHSVCLQNSLSRSNVCPECRGCVLDTLKIYLNFEESEGSSQERATLQAQLDRTIENNRELVQQLEEKEGELQAASRSLDEHVRRCSDLVNQIEQSEGNFLQLQEQLAVAQDVLQERENEIQLLKGQNASQETKIEAINEEHSEICEHFVKALEIQSARGPCETEEPLNNLQIKIAEDQLAETMRALQKQDAELTLSKSQNEDLTRELEALKPSAAPATVPNWRAPAPNSPSSGKHPLPLIGHPMADEAPQPSKTTRPSVCAKHKSEMVVGYTVVVGNVSPRIWSTSHVEFILKLARLMELPCSESDVVRTFILKSHYKVRHHIQSNTVSLMVQFKTRDLKEQFINKREKLANHDQSKAFRVFEYVSDATNILYHKARALHAKGFRTVYCKEDAVYAAKPNEAAIKIIDTDHLEKMLSELGGVVAAAGSGKNIRNDLAPDFDLFDPPR